MSEPIPLECVYCTAPLRNFAAVRMVTIHRQRVPACADIDACNASVAAQERLRCLGSMGEPQAEQGARRDNVVSMSTKRS